MGTTEGLHSTVLACSLQPASNDAAVVEQLEPKLHSDTDPDPVSSVSVVSRKSKTVETNFVTYCNPFGSHKLCEPFEIKRSSYSLEPAASTDDNPPGLTGLRNLGNTCYMNAALQALSNCPQLVEYLRNCRLPPSEKPSLVLDYQALVNQMWDNRQLPYDAQEFLRCFLDELHEALKQPVYEWECQGELRLDRGRKSFDSSETYSESSSVESFQTCDSGWSSDQ
ncbi:unnamed protein product, partial [Soboliphyme baturini]|uniref:ubiquitinyl hydrolase 1 n=1 Tax=Soboliphyme baturini TaxID=241478 RepID=A0A183IXE2_9BILA